ncbi:MAG TPA: carboxypeptidase regulatory-like domain-containing protein [Terriglobales bacterium]|nr:carboxypeptidase regulatory-like domain-containing protein [Terriglobales bacterium]
MRSRLNLLLQSGCLGLISLLLLAPALRLAAQSSTAALQGTVKDASGAVIPGATLQATNIATGIVQTATTDARGLFRFPALPSGTYLLRAEKAGFKAVLQQGIALSVASSRVVDFTLPVGQSSQSITVSAAALQVNTTSAQVSTLINQNQVTQLPLNGRDVEQLVLLAPGVNVYTGIFQGAFYGGGFTYTVAGARPNGQGEELDDSDVQNYYNHGSGAGSLNTAMGADAISEFRILTNTYSAQYGGNGSELVEVTKSGTNQLHGTVYEFLRNNSLDANNYFNNAAGKKNPAFRRNQFGVALGGPIKKNKMFFFVNYEGLRQAVGETDILSLPDANAHQGYLPNGAGAEVCVNQSTIVYPSPACAATIPASVQPFLNFYTKSFPLPTTELSRGGLPTGVGQEVVTPTQTGNENYLITRLDWNPTASDSLFARFLGDFAQLHEPSGGTLPGVWPSLSRNRNQFFTVEEKHIFSPNLYNSVRFYFSRPFQDSATGINSYPIFQYYPGAGLVDGGMSIAGITGFGTAAPGPWHFIQNKFAEGDDVIWNHGNHNIEFGGQVERIQNNVWSPVPGQGSWAFQGLTQFLTAVPFDFSGILPDASGKPQDNALRDFRELDFSFYGQDNWQLTPSLTLNLGLRWEPTTNPVDTAGDLHSIINAPFGTYANVPHVFATNPSLKNFDPRIGLAWSPSPKSNTAVRAGFGIFHDILAARDYAAEYYNNPPFQAGTVFNPTTFPVIPTVGSSTPPTQSFGINYYLKSTPYVEQWNLTVQRQILKNTIASIGYVGSNGVHLLAENDANYPIPVKGTDGQMQFSSLQTIKGRTSIVMNPLLNPAFGALQIGYSSGWSKYNSAQIALDTHQGAWDGHLSYTYSSCVDNDSGSYFVDGGTVFSNPLNYNADRGWCSFYLRNSLTMNTVYRLPFSGNGLVSGWQVSGIYSYHSGFPVSVSDGFAQAFSGGGANRPNAVAACNPVDPNPKAGNGVFWLNSACFTLPPVGELGNVGRNSIIGPGYSDVDFALSKTTHVPSISEAFAVQFRAEAYNIFNHANFANPNGGLFVQQTVSGNATGGGLPSPIAGQIFGIVGNPRQLQFALKFLF